MYLIKCVLSNYVYVSCSCMWRCGLFWVKVLKVCPCSRWKVAAAVKCKLYIWRTSESWKRITQIIKPFQHIKKKGCVAPLAGAGLQLRSTTPHLKRAVWAPLCPTWHQTSPRVSWLVWVAHARFQPPILLALSQGKQWCQNVLDGLHRTARRPEST